MTIKQPVLDTARLILRPLRMTDAPRFYELLRDPEIAANGLGVKYPYPPGEAERFIERSLQDVQNNRYVWGIVLKAEQLLIGILTLIIQRQHNHAEIGYWIGKAYWNQGYTTDAARTLVKDSFERFDLNRIFAESFANNDASTRVMEKLGMIYEGTMRQHVLHLDGNYRDLLIYGLLREDTNDS